MFASTRNVTSALEVYSSLTEIASDKQKDTFNTTADYIALKAGSSAKTVGRILPTLVKIGVIGMKENYYNGVQGPSTYTLFEVDVLPHGHDVPPDGLKILTPRLTSEESFEEVNENTPMAFTVTPSADFTNRKTASAKSWRKCYSEEELEVIDKYHEICVPHGWRRINQDSQELHDFLSIYLSPGSGATDWETIFGNAVNEKYAGDPVYNRPKGNKLIRILAQNLMPHGNPIAAGELPRIPTQT